MAMESLHQVSEMSNLEFKIGVVGKDYSFSVCLVAEIFSFVCEFGGFWNRSFYRFLYF